MNLGFLVLAKLVILRDREWVALGLPLEDLIVVVRPIAAGSERLETSCVRVPEAPGVPAESGHHGKSWIAASEQEPIRSLEPLRSASIDVEGNNP